MYMFKDRPSFEASQASVCGCCFVRCQTKSLLKTAQPCPSWHPKQQGGIFNHYDNFSNIASSLWTLNFAGDGFSKFYIFLKQTLQFFDIATTKITKNSRDASGINISNFFRPSICVITMGSLSKKSLNLWACLYLRGVGEGFLHAPNLLVWL